METIAVLATIAILFGALGIAVIANDSVTLRAKQYTNKFIASLINEGNEPEEPEYAPFEELTDEEAAEFLRKHKHVA